MFVKNVILIKKNILYVASGDDSAYLLSDSCIVDTLNFINGKIPEGTHMQAKFRYRQKDIEVFVRKTKDDELEVSYPSLARAVTPGQACVFYSGEKCLGGGIIKEVRYNNEKLWYL